TPASPRETDMRSYVYSAQAGFERWSFTTTGSSTAECPCSPTRFTTIYRDLARLIRSRREGALVFGMQESPLTAFGQCRPTDQTAEDVMRDLKADWRRWTRVVQLGQIVVVVGLVEDLAQGRIGQISEKEARHS